MICERLEIVESLDPDTQVIRVFFDNKQDALMLFNYSDALQYIGQDVIVKFRKDIYNEQLCDFVQTITCAAKVNTFVRDTGIKLYADRPDSNSNVSSADLAKGDVSLNAVMYCSDIRFKTSVRAHWAELTVLDKSRCVRKLRVFDPDNSGANYCGQYVKSDIRMTEYGLCSNAVLPTDGTYAPNPDVAIALKYIQDVFSSDAAVTEFIDKSGLLRTMEKHIDIEPGYLAVRTAIELDLACELANVCSEINIDAVKRALLFSKVHILAPDSVYSREVCAITIVSRYKNIPNLKSAPVLIDDRAQPVQERKILQNIVTLADSIIMCKKGITDEKNQG